VGQEGRRSGRASRREDALCETRRPHRVQGLHLTARRTGYKTYTGSFRSEGEAELKVRFSLEKSRLLPRSSRAAFPPAAAPADAAPAKSIPPGTRPRASSPAAPGRRCSNLHRRQEQWPGDACGPGQPARCSSWRPYGRLQARGASRASPQKVNIREDEVTKLINVRVE
jgi:hypothetical protein